MQQVGDERRRKLSGVAEEPVRKVGGIASARDLQELAPLAADLDPAGSLSQSGRGQQRH